MTVEHDYPQMAAARGRIELAPRRVRGFLGHELVFDTTAARYVWEVLLSAVLHSDYVREFGSRLTTNLGVGYVAWVAICPRIWESLGDIAGRLDGVGLAWPSALRS